MDPKHYQPNQLKVYVQQWTYCSYDDGDVKRQYIFMNYQIELRSTTQLSGCVTLEIKLLWTPLVLKVVGLTKLVNEA